jgi:tetratricopeptide (TPR) repeat protein
MKKSNLLPRFPRLKRFILHLKAELMVLISPGRRAEIAWFDVMSFELKILPLSDPSRAHAFIELARCYLEQGRIWNAKGFSETASKLVANHSAYDFLAAQADCLRGRIETIQGDTKLALMFHERAERLFIASNSFSEVRSENLDELAKCYRRLGRPGDAEEASLRSSHIRLCASYLLPRYP